VTQRQTLRRGEEGEEENYKKEERKKLTDYLTDLNSNQTNGYGLRDLLRNPVDVLRSLVPLDLPTH
jgi:hypothetical protein